MDYKLIDIAFKDGMRADASSADIESAKQSFIGWLSFANSTGCDLALTLQGDLRLHWHPIGIGAGVFEFRDGDIGVASLAVACSGYDPIVDGLAIDNLAARGILKPAVIDRIRGFDKPFLAHCYCSERAMKELRILALVAGFGMVFFGSLSDVGPRGI